MHKHEARAPRRSMRARHAKRPARRSQRAGLTRASAAVRAALDDAAHPVVHRHAAASTTTIVPRSMAAADFIRFGSDLAILRVQRSRSAGPLGADVLLRAACPPSAVQPPPRGCEQHLLFFTSLPRCPRRTRINFDANKFWTALTLERRGTRRRQRGSPSADDGQLDPPVWHPDHGGDFRHLLDWQAGAVCGHSGSTGAKPRDDESCDDESCACQRALCAHRAPGHAARACADV